MKNKKIVITLLTILIVMLAMVGRSYAANSFSAGLTPNSSKVNKGGEVKVTFKLSSISVDGGINAITAVLKYDEDVLSIKEADVKGMNDWSKTFNEENGKLAFDKSDATTEDEEVATFTFKVADSTQATTSTIKLVSIEGANSSLNEGVKISDISTTITIGSGGGITSSPTTSASPSQSQSSRPSESTAPTTSSSVKPSSSSTTSSSSMVSPSGTSSTNGGTMPNTGSEQSYVLPLVALIAILGTVSFINYKKIDSK